MMNQLTDVAAPAEILAQTGFFAELTPGQRERVAALSQVLDCTQSQQVYRVGDPANVLYVLVHGMVRHSIGFGSRNAGVGDILRRGDVFGWAALTPACNVRIATASCLTPCRFLSIDGTRLIALMEQDHTLGYRLMTQLNRLITGTLTAFAGG
jgi:CRP-like cAMP-binding protein